MPKVSVVIPALNEEAVIERTVASVLCEAVSEVIVVDNGSSDRTADLARKAGARVVSEPLRGYGRAMISGVSNVEDGCEIIVQMDADLSDDPREMSLLLGPIVDDGYDLVLGSRLLGTREKHSMTASQIFGSKLASLLLRLIYGVRYTDMGPFRAIRSSCLKSLDMREKTYGWSIEMQVKAASRGLRVKEVPVTWRNRIGGESKVAGTLSGSVRAGVRILWTIARLWKEERSARTKASQRR
jgi:glycosyltransferase involved in cell wall biosynthesis